jgi:hypothetical protein
MGKLHRAINGYGLSAGAVITRLNVRFWHKAEVRRLTETSIEGLPLRRSAISLLEPPSLNQRIQGSSPLASLSDEYPKKCACSLLGAVVIVALLCPRPLKAASVQAKTAG